MIHLDRGHLQVTAQSHPGMSGKNNEDRFAVSAFQTETEPPAPVLFAVLADGIGGHRAGEIAAEIAVNTITQQIAESDGRDPLQVMETAIQAAGKLIHEQAMATADQHGMGATCACAWVAGSRLFTATVGDSRIYLLRGSRIQQLSTDHTWIQEALERGFIKPDEVRGHPNAHVIRRYLGSTAPVRPDFRLRMYPEETDAQSLANQGLALVPGDVVLLCSDGLTDLISDREIQTTLKAGAQAVPQSKKIQGSETQDLEPGVKMLVDQACQRGGIDNITIIAMRVPFGPAAQRAAGWKPAWRRPVALSCLGLAGLLALAAALVLGWQWWSNRPISGQTTSTPSPGVTLSSPSQTIPASPAPTATRLQTPIPLQNLPTAGPTLTAWPTHTRPPNLSPTPTP